MLSFESELALENFVWENLPQLLNLSPIARQYYIDGQRCDILAVNSNRQLVVIELKNTEDRHQVQQLTRYYDSLSTQHPFAQQVDYTQPIQLIALAPTFHKYNLIDRKHSSLHYQFIRFKITQSETGSFDFSLTDLDATQIHKSAIPASFHQFITTSAVTPTEDTVRQITLPPKSLRKIIDGCSPELQAQILQIRDKILNFDERMQEVGLTTTTKYGLVKAEKDVYQGKLCAVFLPGLLGIPIPRLLLRLPYSRRKRTRSSDQQQPVKGMAWAEVTGSQQWAK